MGHYVSNGCFYSLPLKSVRPIRIQEAENNQRKLLTAVVVDVG